MDKPVKCPWCGGDMELHEVISGTDNWAFVCECGAVSPVEMSREAAIQAVMQKPLTLEEACGSEEPCVFLEPLGWNDVYAAYVCREQYDTNVCFCTVLGGDCIKKANEYNKTWRCWATKPTYEEMRAAKWE